MPPRVDTFYEMFICAIYSRYIRVLVSHDEQFVQNMPCYLQEKYFSEIGNNFSQWWTEIICNNHGV